MTLLVLDVRLQNDFTAQTSQELLTGVFALGPKFFPYLLSFYVLGLDPTFMSPGASWRHFEKIRTLSPRCANVRLCGRVAKA
jgi:hypothetical protein